MSFDLLVKGGRVLDGTGNPWFSADIGIRDERIEAIGRLEGSRSSKVLDASGLTISPGFIDVHTHSDLMLLSEPRHECKLRQGVTTELVGVDGLSIAPLSRENLLRYRSYFSGLYGNYPIEEAFPEVEDYLKRLDGRMSCNLAYLAPHSNLRVAVMGEGARLPSRDELASMKELLSRSMEAGAFGFSTGLSYPPGCYSDTGELIELCRTASQHGGIYVTHTRFPIGSYPPSLSLTQPLEEAFRIGREAAIPVHVSHLMVQGKERQGRSQELFDFIEGAREGGLDVSFDSFPYPSGSTMLNSLVPTWAMAGGPEKALERLKSPPERAKIKDEMEKNLTLPWEGVRLSGFPISNNISLDGMTVSSLSELQGKGPIDLILDILVEEELGVGMVFTFGEEGDVFEILRHELHMVGSDSILAGTKPHPRAYGAFPRYLGYFVRERKALSLESAIRKITSWPAQRLGLKGRGLLKVGMAADLVVFDPERIIDRATIDEPNRFPEGIEHVVVNGKPVIEQGRHTGALPGRVLRRGIN